MSPSVKVKLLQATWLFGVFLEAPKKDDLYNVLWVNEGIYLFVTTRIYIYSISQIPLSRVCCNNESFSVTG